MCKQSARIWKGTHGLSLPPVTISPSRRVVYMANTGPLCALATTLHNMWSFHTQTSPLMVPVNVKLFWKGVGKGGDKLIKSSKRGRTDVILYVGGMLVHLLWQSTCKGWWETLDPGQEAEMRLSSERLFPFSSLSFSSEISLGLVSLKIL